MNPVDIPITVSSALAVEITGVTYRRIDYWLRQGLLDCEVPAVGSGANRRSFSFGDCVRIATLAAWMDQGRAARTMSSSYVADQINTATRPYKEIRIRDGFLITVIDMPGIALDLLPRWGEATDHFK